MSTPEAIQPAPKPGLFAICPQCQHRTEVTRTLTEGEEVEITCERCRLPYTMVYVPLVIEPAVAPAPVPVADAAAILSSDDFLELLLDCIEEYGFACLKQARDDKEGAKIHDAGSRESLTKLKAHDAALRQRCEQTDAAYEHVHRTLEIRDSEGLLWQKRAEVAEAQLLTAREERAALIHAGKRLLYAHDPLWLRKAADRDPLLAAGLARLGEAT